LGPGYFPAKRAFIGIGYEISSQIILAFAICNSREMWLKAGNRINPESKTGRAVFALPVTTSINFLHAVALPLTFIS
jgi:hypothetical protein